jgi:cell wall-associated NlpC family hydrolase
VDTGEETGSVAFRPHLRTAFGLITTLVLTLATLTVLNTVGAGTAYADPDPPPGASDAAKQLAEAQQDAEQLTEQWHEAQDEMDVKQDEAQRAKDDVQLARRAVLKAKANEERYRTEVDPVVTEAYESGRLDQLNVLITSDSPSDFLDQMTTLDSFTADRLAILNHMVDLTTQSTKAQSDADAAAAHAQQAADEAKAAYTQIGVRKKEAEVRIDQAEKLLAKLDPAEKARRIKDEGGPVGVLLGGSKGALALKAAITRIQKPYVWGATGPNSFDCSGLMYWAFKKVGITLPRSSSAQAKVGRPVSKADLQPGDMVFFYNPVHHVGFYAGNGKVLNAVQTGDVVRYTDLSRMHYNSARRL